MPIYDMDLLGINTSNEIRYEKLAMYTFNHLDFKFLMPAHAPFFEDGFILEKKEKGSNWVELNRGDDYSFCGRFNIASEYANKQIYSFIALANTVIEDGISFRVNYYKTIGGPYHYDRDELLTRIIVDKIEILKTPFESIVDANMILLNENNPNIVIAPVLTPDGTPIVPIDPSYVTDLNPISYYRLRDGEGLSVEDSANDAIGSLEGDILFSVKGMTDSSDDNYIEFNNVNSEIRTTALLTDIYTIFALIQPRALKEFQSIRTFRDKRWISLNREKLSFHHDGNDYTSDTNIIAGETYLVVVIKTPTRIRMLLNDVEVYNVPLDLPLSSTSYNIEEEHFNGLIGEVAYFDKELLPKDLTLIHDVFFNLHSAQQPPVLTLIGDPNVTIFKIEGVIYPYGASPTTVYKNNGKLYFRTNDYDTLSPELELLIEETNFGKFYSEQELLLFLSNTGVLITPIDTVRHSDTRDLGRDFLIQDVRSYAIENGTDTGVINIFGTIEKPYEELGALAYAADRTPIDPVINGVVPNENGVYIVNYSIEGVSVSRTVNVITDPSLYLQIKVPVGYALFKKSGVMEVLFPEGIDPNAYTIEWVQVTNTSLPVVITNSNQAVMSFVGTDLVNKVFRVYINRGTATEQYVDQVLYHSPVEFSNLTAITSDINDNSGGVLYEISPTLVSGFLGTGLGGTDITSNYTDLIDSHNVLISEISENLIKAVARTIVTTVSGAVQVYEGFVKEVYGLSEQFTITIEGVYYGNEFSISSELITPIKGVSDRARLERVTETTTYSTVAVQTTYRAIESIEKSTTLKVTEDIASDSTHTPTSYRELVLLDAVSMLNSVVENINFNRTITPTSNISVG